MAAIVFPDTPADGDRYPVDPGVAGTAQWQWSATSGTWNVVPNFVSLGPTNQDAYNSYEWPNLDGTVGQQLTTDGAGNLAWTVSATTKLVLLDDISASFNNLQTTFNLTISGTPFFPTPTTNILVFLGGVPQIPGATNAYQVIGDAIIFASAPLVGTTFYAISSIIV